MAVVLFAALIAVSASACITSRRWPISGEGAGGSMLILVPKGAPNPTKFAGGNEELFSGAVYTSNAKSFYARPARR